MKENGYHYMMLEKDLEKGREYNAIIDLLNGRYCNKYFIGTFNPEKLNGSSFSYCLYTSLNKGVKCVSVDPDNILSPAKYFEK